eukprot:1153391-Pelagomonas_calceolata.AAC.20
MVRSALTSSCFSCPEEALSLDSLPHDTPFVGAEAGDSPASLLACKASIKGSSRRGRRPLTLVAAVERISRAPKP